MTITTASQATNDSAYFSVHDLKVNFGTTQVVRGLSLELQQGEIGCLLGLSGCGKTTALRAIAGLEKPSVGMVQLGNGVVTDVQNNKFTPPANRGMGMVFQDYALFTHLSVRQNIEFGLKPLGLSKSERFARVQEMLELIELTAHADKHIHELSGGQQQRVALARALAPRPKLLLLDEPFSNLDMMLRESLAKNVRDILKQTNTTAILVTHDQFEAFAIADKVGVMHQGKLAQWATARELYHQPASPFVAEFVGEGAMIDGVIKGGVIKTALGDIAKEPQPVHPSEVEPMPNCSIGDTCRYELPNDTPFKLLIRPDDIVHDDASTQQAVVVDKVFRGANFLYRLRLDNGEVVLSLVPSHHDHQIGERIGFVPDLAHVVLFSTDTIADELETVWHRI